MSKPTPEAIQALSDWMIETALSTSQYEFMFGEFCERLVKIGVPASRVLGAMTTLHPLTEAITMLWSERDGVSDLRLIPHGDNQNDDWQSSPLKALIDSGDKEAHYRLSDQGNWSQYPLLRELEQEGIVDYLAFQSPFSETSDDASRQDGLLSSWATDHPDGFSHEHIEALRRLIPRFAIVAKMANRERLKENIAFAYMGEKAGTQVLNGQIKLGDGQVIRAVIWFSDLRDSTRLAEEMSLHEFLELLNDYFDAMAGAVIEHGGEVLRFIGDAALAIFPIRDNEENGEDGHTELEARSLALQSASAAAARAEMRNASRIESEQTPFRYGISLHVGEIMYGNIGVPSRVEFSVIGPAANAAARLESLTKTLDRRVLVSQDFANGIEHDWEDMGKHSISGSGHTMEVLAPRLDV